MSEDILDGAIARAKERGRIWLEEFKTKKHEDQMEYLAKALFYAIEHDPYGYPNGRAHWDEIPDIDKEYKCGTDQWRYKRAAEMAIKIVGYMGSTKNDDS